jgi:hypothetical protein
MLWCILYIQDSFLWKKFKISIFGGISKFLKLIVFRQILTKFGNFGLIGADSATMVMVDSMPSFERKKRKHHNFCKKCQNLACDGLLESPLNFPSTQKFKKIQLQIGIIIVCPRSLNSIYGSHSLLGVKINLQCFLENFFKMDSIIVC